jgi:hypothetical protein
MMRLSLVCALVGASACATGEDAISGRGELGGGSGGERRRTAAVAIRDNVPAYQQAFTERFTVPRLEEGYDRYWYFTERPGERKREETLRALREATTRYGAVDVFLLAHGNRYIDWVAELDPEQRRRIRLVYNTGGDGAHQGQKWLDLGVGSYVAHPGSNVAPVFYVHFLPKWLSGEPLTEAVGEANRATHEQLFGKSARWLFELIALVDAPRGTAEELWAGTEAVVFGDGGLSARRVRPRD